MNDGASSFGKPAYGGEGWSPRARSLAEEIGDVWARCGMEPCEPITLDQQSFLITVWKTPFFSLALLRVVARRLRTKNQLVQAASLDGVRATRPRWSRC